MSDFSAPRNLHTANIPREDRNMIRRIVLVAGLMSVLGATADTQVEAGDPYAMFQVWSHNYSMDRPWHGNYYQQNYGQPLALVVPPTAHMRQTLSWGVSQNLDVPDSSSVRTQCQFAWAQRDQEASFRRLTGQATPISSACELHSWTLVVARSDPSSLFGIVQVANSLDCEQPAQSFRSHVFR